MAERVIRRPLYHGWYIVALAALVYMILIGTTYSAFSLFVIPVSTEFGLSRADMNTALIILNIGSAVWAPFLGRALDRFPLKPIMIGAAILFGLSLVGLGLSRSTVLSAVILLIPLSAALLGTGTLTMTVLVARWFVVQRGRAMALAVLGMSLGGLAIAPVVGVLIEQMGWRIALVSLGVIGAPLLVLLACLSRERPNPGESEAGQDDSPHHQEGRSAADRPAPAKVTALVRLPQFWSIALSTAMAASIIQAIGISLVPLALEDGLTTMQATSLLSAMGGAAVLGKLLLSVVADKVDRFLLLTGMYLVTAILNAVLLTGTSYYMLLGCGAFLGLATGALMPVFYAILADQFGAESFGTVRGLAAPILATVGAVTVRLAGEVYDRTGSYDLLFSAFVVAQLLAAALIYATRILVQGARRSALPPVL